MSARKAALLAMAKMALVDGTVSGEERGMLEPLLGPGESVDALIVEAKGKKLSDLVDQLDRYADRFFLALRAAAMARVDHQLDAREEALYAELVELLGIRPDDRALIERSVAALDSHEAPPLDPRIEQLYRQSSFA
jgi:uncharacterized tellurite resistance protein B-like protein